MKNFVRLLLSFAFIFLVSQAFQGLEVPDAADQISITADVDIGKTVSFETIAPLAIVTNYPADSINLMPVHITGNVDLYANQVNLKIYKPDPVPLHGRETENRPATTLKTRSYDDHLIRKVIAHSSGGLSGNCAQA